MKILPIFRIPAILPCPLINPSIFFSFFVASPAFSCLFLVYNPSFSSKWPTLHRPAFSPYHFYLFFAGESCPGVSLPMFCRSNPSSACKTHHFEGSLSGLRQCGIFPAYFNFRRVVESPAFVAMSAVESFIFRFFLAESGTFSRLGSV